MLPRQRTELRANVWQQKAVLGSESSGTVLRGPVYRSPSVSVVSTALTVDREDLTLAQLNIIDYFAVRLKHERSCFSNCSGTRAHSSSSTMVRQRTPAGT